MDAMYYSLHIVFPIFITLFPSGNWHLFARTYTKQTDEVMWEP